MPQVNLVAVIVAAVASMALGVFWYSPTLFGKQWIRLMGLTDQKMDATKKEMSTMNALSFVGTLVMAYVLGMLVKLAFSMTVVGGMKVGFGAWLGFVAPVQMIEVLFGGKKWELYYKYRLPTGFAHHHGSSFGCLGMKKSIYKYQ